MQADLIVRALLKNWKIRHRYLLWRFHSANLCNLTLDALVRAASKVCISADLLMPVHVPRGQNRDLPNSRRH